MNLRKKFTRIISLVLCFILVFPLTAFALQSEDDYSKHWAADQIKSFLDKGFIVIGADGSFKPNDPITRGDFAAIANKAFNFTEMDKSNFKDVSLKDTYYNDISIAKKAGYLIGFPDGTSMPRGYMSRQEYAVIISRLLKLDTKKYISEANKFNDADAIPSWSKGAVGAVAQAGYMQGEPGNVFNPRNSITRGQAVVVLNRCYLANMKIVYNKPGTYSANIVEGNVTINVPDVILENTTITGNLIIAEGVGEGNVKLKNVIVKGDTIVKGGGVDSITIEDSQIKNIFIIKENNKIRIIASGSTTVDRVYMQSGGILEEQGLTGNGFGDITISENVDPNETIILRGNFDSVQILADGVILRLESGSVTNLIISKTASNTQIILGAGTHVTNMVVDAAGVVVTGTGTIGTAQVNVQGVTIIVRTTTINTAAGVTVAKSLPAAPSTGGSSSGGGSSDHDDDDDDNTPATKYVSAIKVTGAGNATTVVYGKTLQMFAAVTPVDATNKTVVWSVYTLENGTATIDIDGLLEATGVGTVNVTATNVASAVYGTEVIEVISVDAALQAAKDAEALLKAADYVDYSDVTTALAMAEVTNADKIAKIEAINDAMAALVTVASVDAALQAAKDAEALLKAADYVDYSDVTTALAMAEVTNADKIAKIEAINDAMAALVTVAVVDADLQAAKDAAASLTAADYVDYSDVTTALAKVEVTNADKIAKIAAINDAIAALVTVVDADLQVAKDAAASLTAADYVDYSDVTTALAMVEVTNADKIAKTTAINDAIAALELI